MKPSHIFATIALLSVGGMAHAADSCTVSLNSTDTMKFDLREATVSASCSTITIELAHTGKLPATAMGHNVVVSKTADVTRIARDRTHIADRRGREDRDHLPR